MDLYTANSAHSLHALDSQRLARELEYRRVAKERAATGTAAGGAPETVPARPQRSHGLFAFLLMRGHRAAAQ
jgi:hypothetical protein